MTGEDSNEALEAHEPRSGAEYLYDELVAAGIELLIGLPGTQTRPLDRVVAERDAIEYVMARNETAIPHVAWGYFEATGQPAATLTVPGPGDAKAIHGLQNAASDSVPIVHLSPAIEPHERGRSPIHNVDPELCDPAVKANCVVEHVDELTVAIETALEAALTPPYGPVRLGVPKSICTTERAFPAAVVEPPSPVEAGSEDYEAAIELLAEAERPLVLAGGGARRSDGGTEAVRELATVLDAPVAATYKGKGVVPDEADRVIGVTGAHLPAGARRVVDHADTVCAIGTDLDGVTTDDWTLPVGDGLVHVTLDETAIGASYDPAVSLVEDAGRAGKGIVAGLRERETAGTWDGAAIGAAVTQEYLEYLDGMGSFDETQPLRTPAVLRSIRQVLPPEAVVTVDIGGFRLWALQVFAATGPDRFVAAGSWAGMGVGLPAALGGALAKPAGPVVALVGDGGLMMCTQTLHTAVEHDLDLTVIVSNNADYGIISKSAESSTGDVSFAWDRPAFDAVAEGFGCRARRVETLDGLERGLTAAIGRAGPDLLDVTVATEEPSVLDAAAYESAVDLE
jgi:acetolactate synthase-1/2/3 large subunit